MPNNASRPAAGGVLPAANLDRRHFIATTVAATVALPLADFHEAQDAKLRVLAADLQQAHEAYLRAIDLAEPFEEIFLAGLPKSPEWFESDEVHAAWEDARARWEAESGYADAQAEVSRRLDTFYEVRNHFFAARASTIEGLRLKATYGDRYDLLDEDEPMALLASLAADLKALDGGRLA